jgi:hypothetical protein
MTSGAQKYPRFPGTMLVVHAGGLVKTRGPAAQVSRSLECQETIPLPVANNQYSPLHFTIVDGSCARMPRLANWTSRSGSGSTLGKTGGVEVCAQAFSAATAIPSQNGLSADRTPGELSHLSPAACRGPARQQMRLILGVMPQTTGELFISDIIADCGTGAPL